MGAFGAPMAKGVDAKCFVKAQGLWDRPHPKGAVFLAGGLADHHGSRGVARCLLPGTYQQSCPLGVHEPPRAASPICVWVSHDWREP